MYKCEETEHDIEENVRRDGYGGTPDCPSSHTLKTKCGKLK